MAETVFTPALEGIKLVKSENGEILAKPFLDACKHILPVIDKLGASMALVKSDIGGNITRLETKYNTDPAKFNYLYSMVQVEVETKTAKGSSSCTNGLLWLTRAMDFLVELFRNLLEHADWTMSQACTDSYSKTLKKWHGWLASSSFTVVGLSHVLEWWISCLVSKGAVPLAFKAHLHFGRSVGLLGPMVGYEVNCSNFNPLIFRSKICHHDLVKRLKNGFAHLMFLGYVAMKLAPDRKKFMEVLGGDAVKVDIESFLITFTPLLQQNHKFLASVGLDDLKA